MFQHTFDPGKTRRAKSLAMSRRVAMHVTLAAGASDNYFGGVIQVGYRY